MTVTADHTPTPPTGLAVTPKPSPAPGDLLPLSLAAHLGAVLGRHHAEAALPAVLAVLDPHIQPTPRVGGGWLPVDTVLTLQRLLPSWPAGLLTAVLTAARPWLPRPQIVSAARPEPVRPDTRTNGRSSGSGRIQYQDDPTPAVDLSAREREILLLVAEGHPNGHIGSQLYISEDTVKTHVRRLYRKLGATSRAGAVSRAYQLRLLTTTSHDDTDSDGNQAAGGVSV